MSASLLCFSLELTKHGTVGEWQNVFYTAIGICATSGLFFLAFGSGKEEHWTKEYNSSELILSQSLPTLENDYLLSDTDSVDSASNEKMNA